MAELIVPILIDHGSAANAGDGAMLASALDWHDSRSAGGCAVMERPGFSTGVLGFRKFATEPAIPMQLWITSRQLSSTPFLWRFAARWDKHWAPRLGLALASPLSTGFIFGAPATISAVNDIACRYDALHVVGGGYLTDVFFQTLWQKCLLIHAFANRRKPIVLTGQQIGPFSSEIARRCAYRALRRADFVGLREPTESVDHCRAAGISDRKYCVMGDDSFGLAAANTVDINKLLVKYGIASDHFLAVNVRLAAYVGGAGGELASVARLLRQIAERMKLPLLAVPVAFGPSDSDIATARRLQAFLPSGMLQILDGPELDATVVKGVLGKAYGAIGVSYHFCTFALSQGVPAVSLSIGNYYGQKSRGLCAFWGDDRLGASVDTLSHEQVDALGTRIVETLQDDVLRARLAVRSSAAINEWRRAMEENLAFASNIATII